MVRFQLRAVAGRIRVLSERGCLSRRLSGHEKIVRIFRNRGREFRALFFRRVQEMQIEVPARRQPLLPPRKGTFLFADAGRGTPSAETLAASDKLAYDLLLFVRNKYPQKDYELFRLKTYEAKCSFRNLSAYAGISVNAVRQRINGIADTLRNHRNFSRRYACVNM